jgi:hypothetical protein
VRRWNDSGTSKPRVRVFGTDGLPTHPTLSEDLGGAGEKGGKGHDKKTDRPKLARRGRKVTSV